MMVCTAHHASMLQGCKLLFKVCRVKSTAHHRPAPKTHLPTDEAALRHLEKTTGCALPALVLEHRALQVGMAAVRRPACTGTSLAFGTVCLSMNMQRICLESLMYADHAMQQTSKPSRSSALTESDQEPSVCRMC